MHSNLGEHTIICRWLIERHYTSVIKPALETEVFDEWGIRNHIKYRSIDVINDLQVADFPVWVLFCGFEGAKPKNRGIA